MQFNRYIFGILGIFIFIVTPLYAQDIEIETLALDGKITYVGSDFNIHTLDVANAETYQLSTDGSRRARYEFPTWSEEGQLAYFCCSAQNLGASALAIYLSDDGMTPGEQYYRQDGESHVYAYWSPKTCKNDNCVDLAVLIQDFSASRLKVELFNSQNIIDGQRTLGEGAPFYYSWSPQGESLLIHRNNNALQYYSVESTTVISASDQPLGDFLSPGWSPIDDRILFVGSTQDDLSNLTLLDGNEQFILADNLDGVVSFSWSPNGQYVAYRYVDTDFISPVNVIDIETGEHISASNVSGVISFFWSPDSQKIAYITLSNPPGTFDINNQTTGNAAYLTQVVDGLAWNILDIEDNTNTLRNSFIPTFSTQYLLTNFDQFAQSHRIWSPDSTHIVYAERAGIDSQESLITILDITDLNAVPFSIAEGTFAVWSYK